MLVVVTKNYIDKVAGKSAKGDGDNCLKEFNYAELMKTTDKMLAVVHEPRCLRPETWKGPVGALASSLYSNNVEDDKFEENMQDLLRVIVDKIADPILLDVTTPSNNTTTGSGAATGATGGAVLRPISWAELQLDCTPGMLGKGAFGEVYKAVWTPKKHSVAQPVAVKMMSRSVSRALSHHYEGELGRAREEALKILEVNQQGGHVLTDLVM